jgi:PadR family transcriptional regulator PadR
MVVMVPIVPRTSDTPMRLTEYCAFRSSVHRMDTTQLLKGVLDLAVLAVVDDEDGYGYDIVRRLRDGGLSDVGDASVYGTLRRLYSAGALTSYVVPSESGPHRKYYGITPTGRAQLKQQRDDWAVFASTVTGILQRSREGVTA